MRRSHGADPERQQDERRQCVAQAGEGDRRQVEIVQPDLDQDPGGRPQERDEQRLEDRQRVLAAGARVGEHRS